MTRRIYNIFDFDQTLTIEHTFGVKDGYDAGKVNARTNMKVRAKEHFLHDVEHLSAIATYHNNAAFIAGFVAEVLGKELTYLGRMPSDIPGIAIDRFSVEGHDIPFFISYIDTEKEEEYPSIVRRLCVNGKNDQILSLRRVLLSEGLIEMGSVINFYDDSESNYSYATQLPQINSHLISVESSTFTLVDTRLCDPAKELDGFVDTKAGCFAAKRDSIRTKAIASSHEASASVEEASAPCLEGGAAASSYCGIEHPRCLMSTLVPYSFVAQKDGDLQLKTCQKIQSLPLLWIHLWLDLYWLASTGSVSLLNKDKDMVHH